MAERSGRATLRRGEGRGAEVKESSGWTVTMSKFESSGVGFLSKPAPLYVVILLALALLFPEGSRLLRNLTGATPGMASQQSKGLGIEDLIRRVKSELADAEAKRIRNNEAALFELKEFELEIGFVVQERTTAGGKIDYQVVSVDTGTEVGNERVQRIRLRWTTGGPVQQSARASPLPLRDSDDGSVVIHGSAPPAKEGAKE